VDRIYCNFTTKEYAWQPLQNPIIDPLDNAVNIPINAIISIDFPLQMNRSSVQEHINASFPITGFDWSNGNMTLILEHDVLQYFTKYTISIDPGLFSASGVYCLMAGINVSFVTISGLVNYLFGPITDTTGKPVQKASVSIYNSSGGFLKSSVTNETGWAVFYFGSKLPTGDYYAEIIRSGYKSTIWNFTIYNEHDTIIGPPTPLVVKKGSSKEGWDLYLIVIIMAIVVLIIIFVLLMYMIVFRLKPRAQDQTSEAITSGEMNGEPTGPAAAFIGFFTRIFGHRSESRKQRADEIKSDHGPNEIKSPPALTPKTTITTRATMSTKTTTSTQALLAKVKDKNEPSTPHGGSAGVNTNVGEPDEAEIRSD
jgi:hypothetical protein